METSLIQSVAILIGAIGALLIVWLVVKRWSARALQMPRGRVRIRVLQRLPLGQRREIMVFQIDTTIFVVGVTDHQFTVLQRLSVDQETFANEPPSSSGDYSIKAFLHSLRTPVPK